MRNRNILYETLKRYLEYNFELTKAQGEFYAKEVIDIFDKCPDIPEKENSPIDKDKMIIDKDKMIFEFQSTLKELVKALNEFANDYRTAHGMNYEDGGGMFGGLFGRKK